MGKELVTCGAAVSVWKCGKENPVYDQSGRKREFKPPQSHKKGAFPNENALFKLLYLRITELYKKWNQRPVNNWALVRNQLDTDEKIQKRIRRYENGGF